MKPLLLLLTVFAQVGYAQATLLWHQPTRGVAIATDSADHVYTVDWDQNPAGDIDLTKHDALGTFLWRVTYDNTNATRHEAATWVETDNDDNILVSGTIRSGFSSPVNANALLMKFDSSGTLLWRRVFESDFDGSSTKKCLVDANNNIYVLGLGTGPSGIVTKVKKFSSDGDALWSYFNAAGIGAGQNFKFTPDHHLVIWGRSSAGSFNGYAKIDLDGNEVWSLAGIGSLSSGDIAGDSSGNTYIINGQYVQGATGGILTKLNTAGAAIWSVTNSINATKVEVGSDQHPVIGGFPNSGGFGVAFMKYDTSGNVLWLNPDADGPGYNLLTHAIMKLDVANNAYLAAGTLFEMAVCRVNADGTSAWVAHSSGANAADFDFGKDCSLYVVGGGITRFTQPPPDVSCTRTTLGGEPGAISIALPSAEGGLYLLEHSENLSSWSPRSEIRITLPGVLEFTDNEPATSGKFYRIVKKDEGITP